MQPIDRLERERRAGETDAALAGELSELGKLIGGKPEALELGDSGGIARIDKQLRLDCLKLDRMRAGVGGGLHELASHRKIALVVVADLRDDRDLACGVGRAQSHQAWR